MVRNSGNVSGLSCGEMIMKGRRLAACSTLGFTFNLEFHLIFIKSLCSNLSVVEPTPLGFSKWHRDGFEISLYSWGGKGVLVCREN